MAIAQRSFLAATAVTARPVSRPNRTVRKPTPIATPLRRPARPGARMSVAPLLRPMLAATLLTTTLVSYLSGHAQMTSAGYQRVKLQVEERNLRAELNLLQASRNEQGRKDTIARWADTRGFVMPASEPMVLSSTASSTASSMASSVRLAALPATHTLAGSPQEGR